jgi:drug/metabolite transporter (DMT)-like permease
MTTVPAPEPTDNRRGILLMIGAMAAFAVEDTLIKLASASLPAGQIIAMIGMAGAAIFAGLALRNGEALGGARVMARGLWLRNLAEVVGTFGFVTALTLIPLSTASAILQASPIVVTAGAALFLGERVGWRRWSAIAVGFAGVMLILRPGGEAFEAATLWAVLGMAALAARDLVTRRMPPALPTTVVAFWGNVSVAGLGLVMLGWSGGATLPDPRGLAFVAGAVAIGAGAYWAIIEATRTGDVAVVQPFRYSRLLFALVLGMIVFGERPDVTTLAGAALVLGAGLYTFAREQAVKRASHVSAAALDGR